tara:strand:+ start:528 stop:692 length:165 start_codon:yes stop_codon:yes gene_type:complete
MKQYLKNTILSLTTAFLLMFLISASIANASDTSQIQSLCAFEADGEFPFKHFCK